MNSRIAHLKNRIAALEKKLAQEEANVEADGASMIKGCGKTAETLPEPPELPKTAGCEDADGKDLGVTAKTSLRSAFRRRAGIEDSINQKYLTDVEGITKTPAGVLPSIRKLRHAKMAVARLDRIADELEKQGKIALAYRVDRVTDELEARINNDLVK